MIKQKPVILKLGGSVITFKERPLTPNNGAIIRLAEEIKRSNVKSLIIIHGGGSFGHPFAKEYEIAAGYSNSGQLIGFSKTHEAMIALNRIVVDALLQKNIPAVAVQPSAFIITKKGRIVDFNRDLISQMLNMALIPVMYGDAVLDSIQGFSILSGDQLAAVLATSLGSRRVIICLDVDGLYTSDPKINPAAELITNVSSVELKTLLENIGRSANVDVTGGMHGKISELIPVTERGVTVKMINGKRVNRLYKALTEKEVRGTEIKSVG